MLRIKSFFFDGVLNGDPKKANYAANKEFFL